ncbi:MAG TPA: hypothetical protein DEH78_31905, partial [Solibacterales bacterium]|nr:hypothetical protein [Bryobacterales bacterium]
MPTSPTYPGVYIEEVPSGVRTITGVSTSVAAFVGYTPRGPVDKAVKVFDFGTFEREFGGIASNSETGYAVQQFFLNGGAEAWIVRVASGAARASITLGNATGVKVLTVAALSEGVWGNNLRIDVDYDTASPTSTFNLTATELALQNGTLVPVRTEVHRNLSMDSSSPSYVEGVVKAASKLITATRHAGVTPAVLNGLAGGTSLSGDLDPLPAGLGADARFVSVTVNGDGPYEVA